MKKLLAISLIVTASLVSAGMASAGTIYTDSYTGWAADAFASAGQS